MDLIQANPAHLAELIELEPEIRRDASSQASRDAWLACLALPLTSPSDVAHSDCPHNVGELLRHPAPQAEWFTALKDYAKHHAHHPASPLLPSAVTAVYYVAIGLARLRCGTSITQLSDQELAKGIRWTLKQNWIDEDLREDLARALPNSAPQPP
ncbi:MAG TPA: hypothetical protein P5186_26600 [Candidatus Paceibacterota bacterium]|nr:hypothetical protein [Verrucomicrobiota bacterium]HRY51624.1 hypothetical protein [Candidatus Paceibacterota bacterium]